MLAHITAEQLDEWRAADELDQLLGQEKLYQVLSLLGCALVNSWGGKTEPKHFIPRAPADLRQQAKRATGIVTPNQAAALFAQSAHRFGLQPRSDV